MKIKVEIRLTLENEIIPNSLHALDNGIFYVKQKYNNRFTIIEGVHKGYHVPAKFAILLDDSDPNVPSYGDVRKIRIRRHGT